MSAPAPGRISCIQADGCRPPGRVFSRPSIAGPPGGPSLASGQCDPEGVGSHGRGCNRAGEGRKSRGGVKPSRPFRLRSHGRQRNGMARVSRRRVISDGAGGQLGSKSIVQRRDPINIGRFRPRVQPYTTVEFAAYENIHREKRAPFLSRLFHTISEGPEMEWEIPPVYPGYFPSYSGEKIL